MKILTAIINSIWNTVTFMDKEQRALVAHVLTVSQAHPKSFSYDNQHGTWQSKGLKITFWERHGTVELSNVKYEASWRAVAILKKHFAMLHICLHHEHIGKALSEIDKSENEPKKKAVNTYNNQQTVGDLPIEKMVTANVGSKLNMVTPTDGFATKVVEVAPELIDLSEFVGEEIVATKRDGGLICGEVKSLNNGCYHISGHIYLRRGVVWHCGRPSSKRDIIKIEIATQPIDLAKYVGKNCYVEMSNGDKGNCYVNYLQTEDAVLLLDSQLLFNRYGKHVYGYDLHVTLIQELEGSFRDCIKADDVIKPVDNFEDLDLSGWTTDIDLTKWIGKTVDVKLRNGAPINNVLVSAKQDGVVYHVDLGCMPYTKHGSYWHYQLDGRDIVAIKIST